MLVTPWGIVMWSGRCSAGTPSLDPGDTKGDSDSGQAGATSERLAPDAGDRQPGNLTLVRLTQSAKALSGNSGRLSGIVMSVRVVQLSTQPSRYW